MIPKNVLELPLEQRAEMALKAAVEKLLVARAREALPVYVRPDSRVTELSPKEVLELIDSPAPARPS